MEHPGPVDNGKIMKSMCRQRPGRQQREEAKAYQVSKHLFYFFVSLYGGGPAIVQNEAW